MKKNTKKTSSKVNYVRIGVVLPEVVNMDDLAYVSDVDLGARGSLLAGERERVVAAGLDPMPWDVELSYVEREVRIRNVRRMAHERYLRFNPDERFFEQAPPAADDNDVN